MDRVLRVGLTDWIGYAPFYLAADLGYYHASNIEIQFKLESKVRHDLFRANELDCVGTSVQALCLEVPNVDARIVTALNQSVSPGSERILSKTIYRSMEDLQHATICYIPNRLEHFYFRYLFDQAGLPFPANAICVESRPEMLECLHSGMADAVISYEPFITTITSDKNFHVIPTNADLSIVMGVLVVHQRAVENQQEQLQSLISGYFRALVYLNEFEQKALTVLLRHFPYDTSTPVHSLRQELAGLKFFSEAENLELFDGLDPRLQRSIDESAKVWREIGSVVPLLDAKQLTQARFLRQISEESLR